MHGSEDVKAAGDVGVQDHSRLVARGKYLHGFEGGMTVRRAHRSCFSDARGTQFIKSSPIVSRNTRRLRKLAIALRVR